MGVFDDLPEETTPKARITVRPVVKSSADPFADLPNTSAFDDLPPEPTHGYLAEGALAIGRGALNTLGSTLEGYGAQIPELARQRIEAVQATQNPLPENATANEAAAFRLRRGQVHPSQDVIDAKVAADLPMAETAAKDTSLYKAGAAISGALPESQKTLNPLVEDVLGGVGSVGANIATSMIPVVGPSLTVASNLGQGAGEAAESAVKAGATEDQIARAAGLGNIAGATEFVDAMLPKLGSTGKAAGLIKRVGIRVLEGVFIEGGQEGLQQFIQNLITRGVYKPDQELKENVARSALVGAIVGGGVTGLLGGHKEAPSTKADEQAIQEALDTMRQTVPQPQATPPGPTSDAGTGPVVSDAAPVGGPGDQLAAMKVNAPANQQVPTAPVTPTPTPVPPVPAPTPGREPSISLEQAIGMGWTDEQYSAYLNALNKPVAPPVAAQPVTPITATGEPAPVEGQMTTLDLAGVPHLAQWVMHDGVLQKAYVMEDYIAPEVASQPKRVQDNYQSLTQPAKSDVNAQERDPKQTTEILVEQRQLEMDFARHADQIIQTARGYPPSTTVQLTDMPDQERAHTNGAVPVESDFQPNTTIDALPPGVVMASQGQVAPVQPGAAQVLPPATRVRIYEDNKGVKVDINSIHFAYAQQWLDAVVPEPSAQGAWTDLATVIHRTVKNRLKQVIPAGLQVHFISDADMAFHHSGNTKVEAVYIYDSKSRLGPVILVRESLLQDPKRLSHVMVHEITHAATVHALERQDAVGAEFRTNLRLIMMEANDQLAKHGVTPKNLGLGYAFTNESEFLAELFSNTELQRMLSMFQASPHLRRALKLDGPRKVNMFSAFLQLMHRALGMPYNSESFTILEAALRTSSSIIDAQARLPHPMDLKSNAYAVASKENKRALSEESPHLDAAEAQPETEGAKQAIKMLFSKAPTVVRQAAAHADQAAWHYKYLAGLSQLRNVNPNHTPLLGYTELTEMSHRVEVGINDAAVRIGKDWLHLGDRGNRLSNFIDDLAHMNYRSQSEVNNSVIRHPSDPEFQALARKHNMDKEMLDLFNRITVMISGNPKTGTKGFLQLIRDSIAAHLTKTITNPQNLANRIVALDRQIQAIQARPYFPFTNFGQHFISIRDPSGKMVHAETVERQRVTSAERIQKRRIGELARDFRQQYGRAPVIWKPGMHTDQADIIWGKFPDHAGPLFGMPAPLLDHITQILNLTPEQINVANTLQLAQLADQQPMLSPRFQRKYYVPGYGLETKGYSKDLKRSFAHFFFHGGKFYARSRFIDDLKAQIKAAEALPGNKEADIAAYMKQHYADTVENAKGDWGKAKAFIFLFGLGGSVAAAAQNLSQVPIITHSFLWAKFGERKSVMALVKSMARLTGYYKYGQYAQGSTNFENKALEYAIRTGRISESQASEIAAMSQHGLLNGIGGGLAERNWTRFMQISSKMFEMAEQWNRRITFRAALELASKNPQAKYNAEAMGRHRMEYQQLLAEGYAPAQAAAIITAVDVVDQTQYVYARWDRPKFMRKPGPSLLFVFKKYQQSTLFMLGQNPDVAWRYMLIQAFIGGLAGLPFSEDLLSIVKGLGAAMDKDWDMEREARKYILQFFDGTIDPDIVLRGFARRGMGIPAGLDLAGSLVTGKPGRGLMSQGAPVVGKDPDTGEEVKQNFAQNVPFPVLDRSRAYGMGQILPVDIGKMMTPVKNVSDTIAEQSQKASGAFFSVGFNMYKSMMNNDLPWGDVKRWERAMPRALGDASEAFRAFTEGRERTKGGVAGGSTVVSYDPRDTEQMMEAIAIGLGYNTVRKQARWDNVMKKMELSKYYEIQKQGLLGNYYEAAAGQNEKEADNVMKAIEKFNNSLPEWAAPLGIDGDMLIKSVEGHTRARAMRENNLPAHRKEVPMAAEIDRLYPESVIDVRRR